jgi:hypothetical protein
MRVVDAETGAPVAAARLAVHGRGTVYAGRDGRFELPALARGAYDLDVSQIGYYEQRLRIGVVRDDSLVFRLAPQPVLLEELKVYASRLAQRAERASVAARAYGDERLKVAASGSILDFLRTDGGLLVVPCDAGQGYARCATVRGIPEPVIVYVDGLPSLGGLDELGEIPVGEVFHVNVYGGGEQVEVFTRRYSALESHKGVQHLRTPASMPRGIRWQGTIGDPNHP